MKNLYLCFSILSIMEECEKQKAKDESGTYDHVIKYTGLFGGIQGVNLLASLVKNKLVAVILGPSGLGLISLYNTATTLLNNSTNLGIPFSAVRHISELYEQGDSEPLLHFIKVIRSWSLVTALCGMLACILLSPLLSLAYFHNMTHWTAFLWLSLIVALMTVSGCELAILKGTRQLRKVAVQSVMVSLGAILFCLPVYLIWGTDGIIASLLLIALLTVWSMCYYSCRSYPFRYDLKSVSLFKEGCPMIRLGIAYTLGGILTAGGEFVIRAFMMRLGTEADVGLYNAGYALTVTYASMVFTAMETDYFPRLSAVNHDIRQSNETVNRQVEVSLLLIAPLLVGFLVFLPVLLPLLYSVRFNPVIQMAQFAILGMFFRAITLPVAYLTLAKGRSKVFLFTESSYDIFAVLAIVMGYSWDGLRGAGIALLVSALFDLLLVWLTCRTLYHFRLHRSVMTIVLVQLPLIILAFLCVNVLTGCWYWLGGVVCIIISAVLSVYMLGRRTTLLNNMMERLKRRN